MSVLKADTIQSTGGGAATLTKQHAAKQWCHIEGDGTPTITDSFNVASVTDISTGITKQTCTNNFANVGFSTVGYGREASFICTIQEQTSATGTRTTSNTQAVTGNTSGAGADTDGRSITAHGDLA